MGAAHMELPTAQRRRQRESGILDALVDGPATIRQLAEIPAYRYLAAVSRDKMVRADVGSLHHRGLVAPYRSERWSAAEAWRLTGLPKLEPAGAWTLNDVAYWLASGEGQPSSAFERDRGKALAGVLAAIRGDA